MSCSRVWGQPLALGLGPNNLVAFSSKSASFQSIGVSGPAAAEFWRGRYSLMGSRRMIG
ncbi:hypothetical protein WN944_010948 [Citrus x changshan-huyou]|uniref:Uncharacterized protein n=1 Tax=Citrus x changshan-huyou TaxID=2935761 RepID=A0AAP0MYF5_9ROSI